MINSIMINSILISFAPATKIPEIIIAFLLLIDAKIYGLFSYLYRIFMQLSEVKVFDISVFDSVVQNIYIIFGVVALFLVVFSLLQTLINPDDMNKSTTSIKHVITRLIMAIALTCLTPFLFDFLYDFQASVTNFQLIPNLLTLSSLTANYDKKFQIDYYGCESDDEDETEEVDCQCYNGECNGTHISTDEYSLKDYTISLMSVRGYEMGFAVLSGFLHPAVFEDSSLNDSTTLSTNPSADVSEFDLASGLKFAKVGCAVGVATAVVGDILGVLLAPATAGLSAILASVTFSSLLVGCTLGGGAGALINGIAKQLTATNYTWSEVSEWIKNTGEFDTITPFAKNVKDGEMEYVFIVSTIAGIILCYMMFSFCLDLGVRAAKLIFYQLMAPVSFLLSVIPKNKDLMVNWFKAVITTWAEVFVRIFVVCLTAVLIGKLSTSFTELDNIGLIAKSIIILGLVTFAKQIPNLLSDVTGIKSGDMKLGIKDKLATGGAFTAGAIVGGGVSALTRNATNAWMNTHEKDENGKWQRKEGVSRKKVAGSMFKSAFAGGISGAARSGKAGWSAKSVADMKKAASSGAMGAAEARTKRANYRAAHSAGKGFLDDLKRTTVGHIKDAGTSIGNWAGYQNLDDLKRQNRAMDEIKNSRDAFDSTIDELILKEMDKGNFELDTGTRTVDFTNIKESLEALNDAKYNGRGKSLYKGKEYSVAELETIHKNNIRNARYQIQDDVLIGNADWNKLNSGVRAKLAQARVRAIEFKGAMRNNANESVVKNANITGAELDDNVAYKLSKVKSQDIIGVDSVDNFNYGTIEYTDVNYDLNAKKIKWRDGNTGRLYEKVLNEKYDKGLIAELEKNTKYKYSYNYADNDNIDAMNEAIKIKHGENDVQIASKEQHKTDDNK